MAVSAVLSTRSLSGEFEGIAALDADDIDQHIEAALELKIFCEVVILSAATSNAANRLVNHMETYQACRNAALRAAGSISDDIARNFALQQVVRLCCSFKDPGSGRAIADLITNDIQRLQILSEMPDEEQGGLSAPLVRHGLALQKPAWTVLVEAQLAERPNSLPLVWGDAGGGP